MSISYVHKGRLIVRKLTAWNSLDKQRDRLQKGLDEADIVITTGGTSMGEADLLKVSFLSGLARRLILTTCSISLSSNIILGEKFISAVSP